MHELNKPTVGALYELGNLFLMYLDNLKAADKNSCKCAIHARG